MGRTLADVQFGHVCVTPLLLLIRLFLLRVADLPLCIPHSIDELVGVHVFIKRVLPKLCNRGVLLLVSCKCPGTHWMNRAVALACENLHTTRRSLIINRCLEAPV